MSIINRTQDISEQREQHGVAVNESVTGRAYTVLNVRRPMLLELAEARCVGLSGAPTSQIGIQRYIAATGVTTINVGGALTHVAIGSIGVQSFSLPAAGSSLLQLQDGDAIVVTAGGSNAALQQLVVDCVVRNLQDIKTW